MTVPVEGSKIQTMLSVMSYRRCRGRQPRLFVVHAIDAAAPDGVHVAANAASHLTLRSAETAVYRLSSSATQLSSVIYSLGDAAASQDAAVQVAPHNVKQLKIAHDMCSVQSIM